MRSNDILECEFTAKNAHRAVPHYPRWKWAVRDIAEGRVLTVRVLIGENAFSGAVTEFRVSGRVHAH
jgi:hypothetical protein